MLLATLLTFVPMYATPTAAQLPVMAGRIAGVRVVEPPMRMLGDYIAPGDFTGIIDWLHRTPAKDADAFAISTDMLAYGGLDASRVPGAVTEAAAVERLGALRELRRTHPHAWIGAFGTIMRLEPTSVTNVGEAVDYSQIAQDPTWQYIWEYAQLHDPPLPAESPRARHLTTLIGKNVLDEYLWTRDRDRNVDLDALRLAQDGSVDRLVLGQDDAGPVGLHVKDVRALQRAVREFGVDRSSIEPGADELGLALVAHAIARDVRWTPRVAVVYSRPGGAATQDPLEYAPIDVTIGALIRLCGGSRDDVHPDLTLIVRVPHTSAAQDEALLRFMRAYAAAGRPIAFVDLTYLTYSYASQAAFVEKLVDARLAGIIDAYSAWNTDANSVGIALAEAIAAGAGRRSAKYNPIAHAEFMFDRYIDDYLYHTSIRPQVNAELAAQGVTEHYWLAPDVARRADARVRELITPAARELLARIYPRYRAKRLEIFLPWPRTAEIRSEIELVPRPR